MRDLGDDASRAGAVVAGEGVVVPAVPSGEPSDAPATDDADAEAADAEAATAESPGLEMLERLFVYGTLQRGCVNHPLLAGARRLGSARTAPGFALIDLGTYPGMVRRGPAAVAGELYRVTAVVLDALDRFEGHPWLFRRARVPLADGRPAFAYLLAPGQAAGRSLLEPDGDGTVRWTAG